MLVDQFNKIFNVSIEELEQAFVCDTEEKMSKIQCLHLLSIMKANQGYNKLILFAQSLLYCKSM